MGNDLATAEASNWNDHFTNFNNYKEGKLTITHSNNCLQQSNTLIIMAQLLISEDSNILDQLASKNRQLFFLLGSEQDPNRKKQLIQEIEATTEKIRLRHPYQRYRVLQDEETTLATLLDKTYTGLHIQKEKEKELMEDFAQLKKINNAYLQLMQQIKVGKQFEQKVKKFRVESYLGGKLMEGCEKSEELRDYRMVLVKMEEHLTKQVVGLQKTLSELQQKKSQTSNTLISNHKHWQDLQTQKAALTSYFHKLKAQQLSVQIASTSKKTTGTVVSNISQETVSSLREPVRRRTKIVEKSQIVFQEEKFGGRRKLVYFLWGVGVVGWVGGLGVWG